MLRNAISFLQQGELAERRLWRAVIAKTLEEWICGPLTFSRKAEEFLFNDQKDFEAVCASAGMDPQRFRQKLHKLRERGIGKEALALFGRGHKKPLMPAAHWVPKAYGV